jgi:hypothetical protein
LQAVRYEVLERRFVGVLIPMKVCAAVHVPLVVSSMHRSFYL